MMATPSVTPDTQSCCFWDQRFFEAAEWTYVACLHLSFIYKEMEVSCCHMRLPETWDGYSGKVWIRAITKLNTVSPSWRCGSVRALAGTVNATDMDVCM